MALKVLPPHMDSHDLDNALAAALAELQAEYLTSMPDRLQEIRTALSLAHTDLEARTTLRRAGHRIAGTAATVGLSTFGDVGRAIEQFALGCSWTPTDLAALASAADLLTELAVMARDGISPPAVTDDPRWAALRGHP